MSSELLEKLDNVLKNAVSERHSFFQLQNFIIGNEYTIQGKLWQCLRELKNRKDSVDALQNDLENLQDNLELTEIKIEKAELSRKNLVYASDRESQLRLKETLIRIRKNERQLKNLVIAINQIREKIRYIEEEINFFLQAYNELSKVEEVKPFDDIEAQKEYWNAKLTQEINLSYLMGKPISIDIVKLALALDDEAPIKKQMISTLQSRMEEVKRIGKTAGE